MVVHIKTSGKSRVDLQSDESGGRGEACPEREFNRKARCQGPSSRKRLSSLLPPFADCLYLCVRVQPLIGAQC